jgi:Tfp pilus assembly protein PilN
MSSARWISIGLLGCAVVAAALWALQREAAMALRQEIALLRDDTRAIGRLRAENEKLKAQQVSAEELLRLQADRAALQRLRNEIEALKGRTEQRARETEKPLPPPKPAARVLRPTLALKFGITGDGALSMDGAPLKVEQLRQLFARLDKGDLVEIRLRPETVSGARMERVHESMNAIKDVMKELGLRMTVILDRPGS